MNKFCVAFVSTFLVGSFVVMVNPEWFAFSPFGSMHTVLNWLDVSLQLILMALIYGLLSRCIKMLRVRHYPIMLGVLVGISLSLASYDFRYDYQNNGLYLLEYRCFGEPVRKMQDSNIKCNIPHALCERNGKQILRLHNCYDIVFRYEDGTNDKGFAHCYRNILTPRVIKNIRFNYIYFDVYNDSKQKIKTYRIEAVNQESGADDSLLSERAEMKYITLPGTSNNEYTGKNLTEYFCGRIKDVVYGEFYGTRFRIINYESGHFDMIKDFRDAFHRFLEIRNNPH